MTETKASETPRTDALAKRGPKDIGFLDYVQELLVLTRDLERQLTASQAECEQLQADAERYRWLRVHINGHEAGPSMVVRYTDKVLDSVIDSARKGK